jgi:hypothetical protein
MDTRFAPIIFSVILFGAYFYAPIFLLPIAGAALCWSAWALTKIQGLPRKSDVAAGRYRQKWRETMEAQLHQKSQEVLQEVEQRDEQVRRSALALQKESKKLKAWHDQMLATEMKFTAALHEQEQYYIELLRQVEQNAIAEIQMRENSIQQLQNRLMGTVNRPDPKQGFSAWVAQLLLQALQENEVFCQLKGYYKIPGLREVSVWVELQTGTPARKLETISKEVGTLVKMGEPTILWDADECVYEFRFAPQVDYENETYDLVVDAESELPAITEPDNPNWFRDVVCDSKSSHFMIHGPTGAGKSVLVDNLVSVGGDELSRQTGKPVRVWVVDPKFPDSEWTIKGKRFKPQYRRWDGAIEGVLAMSAEVNIRLDASAEIAENVPSHLWEDSQYILPLPERELDFWVIDEAAAMHTLYKEQCSEAYRSVLWVGRSAMVKAILIGQNPNPSNYGLQIPDLGNCTRFYLGITALEALDRFIKPPREQKAKLKAQIYSRLRSVKLKKSQGIANPPEQYFALVVTTSQPPFVAQLPSPKSYNTDALSTPESQDVLDLVSLPECLRDLLAYATQKEGNWITGSEFRQNRNRYKSTQGEVINSWLTELEARGVGECDNSGRVLRYRYQTSD